MAACPAELAPPMMYTSWLASAPAAPWKTPRPNQALKRGSWTRLGIAFWYGRSGRRVAAWTAQPTNSIFDRMDSSLLDAPPAHGDTAGTACDVSGKVFSML